MPIEDAFAQSFVIDKLMHDHFAALLPRGNDGLCIRGQT